MAAKTLINRRNLKHERLLWSLVLATVLVVGFGMLRPAEVTGLYPDVFWQNKLTWQGQADLIVAGDSRTGVGVSPEVLEQHLPGWRVLNFSFNGTGFSRPYLQAMVRVLDPDSKQRAIVLGITPRSLSPASTGRNTFHVFKGHSKKKKFLIRHLSEVLRFTQPMSFSKAKKTLFPKDKTFFYRCYQPDGWLASDRNIIRPKQKLDSYAREFEDNPVSPALIDQLCAHVQQWRQQGILVFGFRPASTADMVQVERTFSGFNEKRFVEQFEESGGIWLEIQQTAYTSFDGSHLTIAGARGMSAELGHKLRDYLPTD